jgi:hypothetical protein
VFRRVVVSSAHQNSNHMLVICVSHKDEVLILSAGDDVIVDSESHVVALSVLGPNPQVQSFSEMLIG